MRKDIIINGEKQIQNSLIMGEYIKIITNSILPSDMETDYFYKNAVVNNHSYRN